MRSQLPTATVPDGADFLRFDRCPGTTDPKAARRSDRSRQTTAAPNHGRPHVDRPESYRSRPTQPALSDPKIETTSLNRRAGIARIAPNLDRNHEQRLSRQQKPKLALFRLDALCRRATQFPWLCWAKQNVAGSKPHALKSVKSRPALGPLLCEATKQCIVRDT